MIEQKIRPIFQKIFVDNVAKLVAPIIAPNVVTILSLICGLVAAVSFFINQYLCVFLLLLSGYLDILDGSVARLQNSSSSFGTMLDILSDRFVESFIIIVIFINQLDIAWVGLLMMMSIIVCISSFLLVGIFSQKESSKSFYYSPGLIERAETFIFFIVMILLPSTVFVLGLIYTLLVLWTTLYRCYEFYCYEKIKEQL
ncbi:CDP-alcohol phosphatidyltransferase family protein [Francisella philomiragia]|uniref:CDP-alcohol phosphatidyltransferase family protein n=1 Tax=Francisella philomiragia subsp. philomiragia (strain ATCC 25017 / CCUG 19701 / FSC 153 / O\|nr:CDP-alcohol phosphatidyltransferase family protein [Francisella philomiragia]AJI47815.1 CDP-alcohol phosphatidyltransferase family protein [Francisella philomiragia]AJI49510.1 CDP-alcohol phosphatidyltransferase family protein [Francisella philomiragia]MBK2020482.1 CDP-alcohol phosphatidyltransferase family protein [Francisella philomiragia]MBK2030182.1 CDP-alcohol phosphatidyltransferase family protein [Francisella philomiragia]MBK2263179.1 CDP-alcohol phosphatidyltransferase family protei